MSTFVPGAGSPDFGGPEVLLALVVGLVVAFATARPPLLDCWPYTPRALAIARIGMACAVVGAGGLVFLVLKRGLGSGRQLGTPDAQYADAAAALLGLYAVILHFEPLLRWPARRPAKTNLVCGICSPLALGAAIALSCQMVGNGRHLFESWRPAFRFVPPILVLLLVGCCLARRYVRAYARAAEDARRQPE